MVAGIFMPRFRSRGAQPALLLRLEHISSRVANVRCFTMVPLRGFLFMRFCGGCASNCERANRALHVLSATLILSKNSRGLDAKSQLKSANLG